MLLHYQNNYLYFKFIISIVVDYVIGFEHAIVLILSEFRCSSSFLSTLFVNVSTNYATVEAEIWGKRLLGNP
jgi:hypothetical protein